MKNLSTITVDQMKALVLAAADLREESYDPITSTYRLWYSDAADLACLLLEIDCEFGCPIGLGLSGWWNDMLDWAGDFEGRVPIVAIPTNYSFPSMVPVKQ